MKQYFCRVLQRGLCAKMSVTLVALLPVQVFLYVLRPIFLQWCFVTRNAIKGAIKDEHKLWHGTNCENTARKKKH